MLFVILILFILLPPDTEVFRSYLSADDLVKKTIICPVTGSYQIFTRLRQQWKENQNLY